MVRMKFQRTTPVVPRPAEWRTIQRQETSWERPSSFLPVRRDDGTTSDSSQVPHTVNCPNHGVLLGPWHFWSFPTEQDLLGRLKTDVLPSPAASPPRLSFGRDRGWASSSGSEGPPFGRQKPHVPLGSFRGGTSPCGIIGGSPANSAQAKN